MHRFHPILFLLAGLVLSLCSFFLALGFGAVHFTFADWLSLFTSRAPSAFNTIIFDIRLPTIGNAFIVGGLLSLSGVLMQVLLRNPLADPYVLGISGGSACALLIGLLLGVSVLWLHVFAYAGAIAAIFLVFVLARTPKQWSSLKLLLTGVILAAGWGAVISFILTISPSTDLHGILFWLIGNIQATQFSTTGLIFLLLGLIISLSIAKPMDLLLRGELAAKTLGVNVTLIHNILYFLSALLTATAVSIAGTIGFVGLVVPHLIRLCIGSQHRWLIPAAVIFGGSLLVLADTLARTVLAPLQLPVGIFTAFIGVPVFLYLLLRKSV